MYTTSTVIYMQYIIFLRGIRYFNPSRKYFCTTLITSMSSVIHQILLKILNETSEVLLTIDFWSNRQMRSCIGVTFHFISD